VKRLWTFATGERPVRNAAARVLWATGLCRHFVISRPGFFIRFHPSSVSCTYWVDPEARAEDERIISALLLPGSTYVDVGANVGTLALVGASKVGPRGRVVAIEANPRTAGFLEENVRENGMTQVAVVRAAVGDHEGTITIENRRADDMNQVSTQGSGESVSMHKLDTLLAELKTVRLLKVDVEGFEKFVLAGAPRTLAKTDFVFIEIIAATAEHFGYDASEILDLLKDAGFECFHAVGENSWEAADMKALSSSGENILAVKDRRLAEAAGLVLSGS
jgi:FkbM family methyltransferase